MVFTRLSSYLRQIITRRYNCNSEFYAWYGYTPEEKLVTRTTGPTRTT